MSLKRRKWAFFYSMFDDFEETITVDVWIAVHEIIRIEDHVKLSHIRTINEHKQSCAIGTLQISGIDNQTSIGDKSAWMDLLDDKIANPAERKKYFASEQRKRLYKLERDALLLRSLHVGDFVWGLYNRGCVWYPAIIEEITLETKEVKLKYLLTTDEVKKYQSLTISRQYLPRNSTITPTSSRNQTSNPKETPPSSSISSSNYFTLPQSIQTEKEVCEYLFDHIVAMKAEKMIEDQDFPHSSSSSSRAGSTTGGTAAAASSTPSSSDYISCQYLIDMLKSSKYHQVILCSAYLTALFHPKYHLDDHLVSMFSSSSDDDGEGGDENHGMISKTEFLEYCELVKDIFIYNVDQ